MLVVVAPLFLFQPAGVASRWTLAVAVGLSQRGPWLMAALLMVALSKVKSSTESPVSQSQVLAAVQSLLEAMLVTAAAVVASAVAVAEAEAVAG
ncbi:unnamed protein product [marine sediment metagenome]|uniref:Uncharacterized protein n=1 Tax=marine sediment metagenome TaxID=412755 RepID=X0TJB4_9ZZZZ